MKKVKEIFFPKTSEKIFKGFGPAFLVIALGIGSGEFILWPFLSAHYGFGILWGALLGITIQLLIITALEKNTAFLGENILLLFQRVFKYSLVWVLLSTFIGFGWPGFAAMSASLVTQGFSLDPTLHVPIAVGILTLAMLILSVGKNAYKSILALQKGNMIFLLILIIFLFVHYFDVQIIGQMFAGFVGKGDGYRFIPAGISLITFMGAIAYAGSGGNLLLMNSFYVEKEQKGLVPHALSEEVDVVPEDTPASVKNTRSFLRHSILQNTIFFWFTGVVVIAALSYISYAAVGHIPNLAEDFSFLITEANIFRETIHPIAGHAFLVSGAIALLGVQIGILDFIGRITATIHRYRKNRETDSLVVYRKGVLVSGLIGVIILLLGFSQPSSLIIIGATINAFSMGIIALMLYLVEKRLVPRHIRSHWYQALLLLATVFYIGFFAYVVINKFI